LRGRAIEFYKKNPAHYAGATRGLSFAEHGAYNLLLDHLYLTEIPLPPRLKVIYKLIGAVTAQDRKDIQYVLRRFFQKTDKGYTQKRFEKELTFVNSRRWTARENGKKGGRPPKKRKPTETQSVSNAKPTETNVGFSGFLRARENPQKPDSSDSSDSVPQLKIMQVLGISLSLFQDFRKVRESTHHPIVSGAEDLIFKELLRFQEQGENPVEVLEQAVRTGSWMLYPVKNQNGNGKGRAHESHQERRSKSTATAIETVLGRFEETPRDIRRALPPADK
jgi:uncharacterized protein YdaU (DUF1376 family)